MNSLNHNQVMKKQVSQYATREDFCHVFIEDMPGLYQLSFLLTGDHDKAEQCFVAGLEDCVQTNRVFREWARFWAKCKIVQKAIRTLQPHPTVSRMPATAFPKSGPTVREHLEVDHVLALEQFERFVFVMSVLEHYSDHDCALLLECSLQVLRRARVRALEQLVVSGLLAMNGVATVKEVSSERIAKKVLTTISRSAIGSGTDEQHTSGAVEAALMNER